MLGRDPPKLEREAPLLGRLKLPARDEPKLGRRTLWVRLGLVLGRLLTPLVERDAPPLGFRTALLRDGLLEGRLIEAREGVVDGGRRTLFVRAGFTRGWLTTVLLGRDRGIELVSVRPDPERPTVLVRAVVAGGRWTTIVRAGVVRARLTALTRVALGRVRVTVLVRVLGARVTVPVRVGRVPTRLTVPVRPDAVGGRRLTVVVRPGAELGRLTTPRVGRVRWTVVGRRGTVLRTGTG